MQKNQSLKIFDPSGFGAFLLLVFFLLVFGHEELVPEEDQIKSPDSDTAVSEIEDGSKEQEVLPSAERHPGRPEGINDRKIQHIHHSAEHERSIIEYDTVEKAVDYVP